MNSPHPDAGKPKARILVIDDEPVVGLSCARILAPAGYEAITRQNPAEGLATALEGEFDLILLDIVMPEMDGLEILRRLRAAGSTAEVVIITGYASVQTAVQAMKQGAADYVSKPFTPEELLVVVEKTLERSALARENEELRRRLGERKGFEGILGESAAMREVFAMIRRLAPTDGTALIIGESGTGKEMVARAIHNLSARRRQPFLGCDCSALAPSLLESELFGHVKGSFSGAIATKKGLFEVADKGTLFLDEVANISLEIQGKLLRALEIRRIKRVGDTEEREVDIRLIAATNRDLLEMARRGEFREDLYYRLNVVPLRLPPLRERAGDIPLLAMSFLEAFRAKSPVRPRGFTPGALRLMNAYAWPGNVRELKNIVERLAILTDADLIDAAHLPAELRVAGMDFAREPVAPPEAAPPAAGGATAAPLPGTWEEFKELKRRVREAAIEDLEKRFLLQALERAGGNVTRAAESVGMQRTNFHALLAKYNITPSGA